MLKHADLRTSQWELSSPNSICTGPPCLTKRRRINAGCDFETRAKLAVMRLAMITKPIAHGFSDMCTKHVAPDADNDKTNIPAHH